MVPPVCKIEIVGRSGLLVIFILVAIISGWLGILILIISTSLGLLTELKQITKSQMMGCLIIPVIIYFI